MVKSAHIHCDLNSEVPRLRALTVAPVELRKLKGIAIFSLTVGFFAFWLVAGASEIQKHGWSQERGLNLLGAGVVVSMMLSALTTLAMYGGMRWGASRARDALDGPLLSEVILAAPSTSHGIVLMSPRGVYAEESNSFKPYRDIAVQILALRFEPSSHSLILCWRNTRPAMMGEEEILFASAVPEAALRETCQLVNQALGASPA